jgi:WD40 repeat protein
MFVSGSWDRTVKIWQRDSAGTFNCQSTLTVDSGVDSVAFSPNGSIIAAANGYEIQLFDAQTQAKLGSPLRGHSKDNKECKCEWVAGWQYKSNPDCPMSGHSDW